MAGHSKATKAMTAKAVAIVTGEAPPGMLTGFWFVGVTALHAAGRDRAQAAKLVESTLERWYGHLPGYPLVRWPVVARALVTAVAKRQAREAD